MGANGGSVTKSGQATSFPSLDVVGRPGLAPSSASGEVSWFLDVLVLLGVLGVAFGLPVALGAFTHSLGIPNNDDWSYRWDLSQFVKTGGLRLDGWGAMTLVGQLVWSAPFVLLLGEHFWVPGFSVAVLGVLGITSAYWLARQVIGRRLSTACVLVVIVFPGFLCNTTSYMTDVPAFSTEMMCLALGVATLQHNGRRRWVLLVPRWSWVVLASQ